MKVFCRFAKSPPMPSTANANETGPLEDTQSRTSSKCSLTCELDDPL